MNSPRYGNPSGSTLLEVMIAVALVAVTALGLVATQLWMTRHANATAARERAAFVADSLVEAVRGSSAAGTDSAQWKSRVASMVPNGETSIAAQAAGMATARVTWAALPETHGVVPANVIDMPEFCGDVAVPKGTACVAIAFAK
ncbi:type IV pilus modification PilV family protein [Paraburkholderia sp. GAS334]|jgi:Tfp pilus assembly protein PilV|uniref:type IV pilus modification PilV family protein n=1 Tax=Paraburkholderia sp. GAS334 TaxID=3035131 RepID=UPI003D2045C8